MRTAVVGAGAIGGFLAVRLCQAGTPVTVIARGRNLDAIRSHGLKLVSGGGEEEVAHPAAATDDLTRAGPHDLVILAVKATAVPELAEPLRHLRSAASVILPMQNGIPWWYFHKHGGPWEGRRIEAVDPDGRIAAHLDASAVIGCVVYPATELVAPGTVRHVEGNRFSLGELDGARTDRLTKVANLFARAGLRAPIRHDIRRELWVKLWGNLSLNPISALTGATIAEICRHGPARALAAAAMSEARAVAERLGIRVELTVEQRLEGAMAVGEHRTSMLQDIEAGRQTEIEALVGAVIELGRLTDTPTPHLDALYACVKLREQAALRGGRALARPTSDPAG